MLTEVIGWFAAVVLLSTIGRQVYTQWRDRSSKGLSRWLFIGQITASLAFVVYSWLLGNWVFVVTNTLCWSPERWASGFIIPTRIAGLLGAGFHRSLPLPLRRSVE